MRTLRLFLAMAVALALLGGLGGAVMAQAEPEVATGPEYAYVTLVSEENCGSGPTQPSFGADNGVDWVRGSSFTCDLVFSDPRVSGTLTGLYNDDCFGAEALPCVYWNSEEISGPDGSWTGGVLGTIRADAPESTSLKVFTGTGAYEGLTFLVHGSGVHGEQDFFGLIYEGNPPPVPGSAPSE